MLWRTSSPLLTADAEARARFYGCRACQSQSFESSTQCPSPPPARPGTAGVRADRNCPRTGEENAWDQCRRCSVSLCKLTSIRWCRASTGSWKMGIFQDPVAYTLPSLLEHGVRALMCVAVQGADGRTQHAGLGAKASASTRRACFGALRAHC
jgi:hypothetical protein